MGTDITKIDWDELRREYDAVRADVSAGRVSVVALRDFCVTKSRELKLSYGVFVHHLKR